MRAGSKGTKDSTLPQFPGRQSSPGDPELSELYVPRLLLIEDNIRYAFELIRALEVPVRGFHFSVDHVRSAAEANSHIEGDDIDIFIVDLKLPHGANESKVNAAVGRRLVERIVDKTHAGIVVHSNIPWGKDAEDLLYYGADEYIEKGASPNVVWLKVFAVWRRVKAARVSKELPRRVVRKFRLGGWSFVIDNREMKNERGDTIRLSPTEHAFIKYLCTVDTEIDRREFNVAILGRSESEEDTRIDNLVYRLREKLGADFQLISKRGGLYKLINLEGA